MKIELKAQFVLFGQMERDDSWYIAHCPPLGLSSQGRTAAEAKKNLREASELFLISCFERGTLEQALKELGFKPVPERQSVVSLKKNCFKLPIQIPFGIDKSIL